MKGMTFARFLCILFTMLLLGVNCTFAVCPMGDLDGDCDVDFDDYAVFAGQWGDTTECPDPNTCADLNLNNLVDGFDLYMFSEDWRIVGRPLIINELMASNNSSGGIPDEYGEYDDWFEIYNPSGSTINLAGMYLTDDLSSPTKW